MKPRLDDWKPIRDAALEHEELARLTGLQEHADTARRMWQLAIDRRLSALYPPQRCVECSATIHSNETKCGRCGRARQGVRVNVVAFMDYVAAYDWERAERLVERLSHRSDYAKDPEKGRARSAARRARMRAQAAG